MKRQQRSSASLALRLERKHPAFVPTKEIHKIESFIRSELGKSGAKGVVVGISGGIDSAVVAALCVKALGARRVLGTYMFEDHSRNSQDFLDARKLVGQLGIKVLDFRLSPIIEEFLKLLMSNRCRVSRLTLANIKSRSRMVILYALANERHLIVAGTGDRSENLLGYFTKFGDGGADILPIGHLYKTEVRALGLMLKLPLNIIMKPSSPNLWTGHSAVEELPADYDVLDKVLTLIYDSRKSIRETTRLTRTSKEVVSEVIKMNERSKHKRELPASLLA
ncbi:MAG: NAD+ synthase [Nitrososphaerales archaeon]